MRARVVAPDPGAEYAGGVHTIDLSAIRPMVAHPGRSRPRHPVGPKNGALVDEIGEVPIDIAYAGSCTAGKSDDLDFYARVLRRGGRRRPRVAAGVRIYIQFGSRGRRGLRRATSGYVELFERAGVKVIQPGCGACIGCGPGVSESPDQVTVSAINRNFKGRSGPGKLYLASPLTVAASAVAGRITAYGPGMFLHREAAVAS